MNEEELFCKLFPEYVVNGKPLSPYFDLFESGYEQAEKRIAELEETNADLKQSLDWANERESEDVKRIADLEKENAELKKQPEMSNKVYNDNLDYSHHIEEQLTNAKDHIKKLLDCLKQDTNDPQTNYYVCQYMDKAEQFLNSEVEK